MTRRAPKPTPSRRPAGRPESAGTNRPESEGTNRPESAGDDDLVRMQALAAFTRARLGTPSQSPFGSAVVETATGRLVVRRLNAVRQENDPSSHAEVRTMRAACKRLGRPSLAGHTLYTTCEPCPMCMAMALWAGVDRVVFGATIDDAARHCAQIHVPSVELTRRSDMDCVVSGPVARAECVALFEDPRMAAAMALWKKSRRNPPAGTPGPAPRKPKGA